jgi:hypothetical protein
MALLALAMGAAPGAHAQPTTTIDARYHDAGTVAQIVTNEGQFGKAAFTGGDVGIHGTEHPIGSFVEHMGNFSMMVGGIAETPNTEGPDTLLSFANPHVAVIGGTPGPGGARQEFLGYSDARCDTIWAAGRGDMLEIPYPVPYPDGSTYQPDPQFQGNNNCPMQARATDTTGYAPVSNQDFITRYNDYNNNVIRSAGPFHTPMRLDVTQASYAFGSPPLNNTIIVRFTIEATEYAVKDAYFGLFVDPNIGFRAADTAPGNFLGDDYSEYFDEQRMGVGIDAAGGTDAPNEPYSMIGVRLFADSLTAQTDSGDDLKWTFIRNFSGNNPLPDTDELIYEQISSGNVEADQPSTLANQTHFTLGVGPFDLPEGESYTTTMAIILGEDRETLRGEASTVEFAVNREFRLPQPPPPPMLTTTVESGTVTLDWSENAEQVENFTDPNRNDDAEKPFEGYRVWKSTESSTGPWTLLGEYDVPGNAFGSNSGLQRTYTDRDLVNSVPYYYAVTSYSKPDTTIGQDGWPSQQTSRNATSVEVVPSTGTAPDVGSVKAVPNPYRGDIRYQDYNPPWEKPPEDRSRWLEQDRKMAFVNLPGDCQIRIYTVSGVLVRTLDHDRDGTGIETWNLTSSSDQAISSGIYLFTVKDNDGDVQTGKFVIIK